ncbi:MAG: MOSC domain-containing protein [Pseudomonadota bacterium]
MPPTVVAVATAPSHDFTKSLQPAVTLVVGEGVVGDAHRGTTVKHRSRVRRDPTAPNLRQVHLIHAEFFEELAGKGFAVGPGDLGENVTTRGIDLLALPRGARLRLGADAMVEVTGLRNPCNQLDHFAEGLMSACLERLPDGRLLRKTGVMAIVVAGGVVRPGDMIGPDLPATPHAALEPV